MQRLRKFQESYSCVGEEDVKREDEETLEMNSFMLSDFLTEESNLEYVDITSAIHWKPDDFFRFVTVRLNKVFYAIFRPGAVLKPQKSSNAGAS